MAIADRDTLFEFVERIGGMLKDGERYPDDPEFKHEWDVADALETLNNLIDEARNLAEGTA